MTDLSRSLRKAAESSWTVLIQGQSGTGKGLAARSIHQRSGRAEKPFIVVNCGALPESLVESEFFGHERGAFTGADRQRKGKFEAAHTGTILLDEIGELSQTSQARLLNVLQDREIERLGGEGRRIPIDIRVIAATNRDLASMVVAGTFRQDLFFRLSVFSVRIPTLRERPEDIAPLAHHFALKAAAQCGRRISGISAEALRALESYSWPGNVRELDNVIQCAVAVGETEEILCADLPLAFSSGPVTVHDTGVRNFHDAIEQASRDVCIAAFKAAKGNCVLAANFLGLHRNSVYRLLRKHGLEHLLI